MAADIRLPVLQTSAVSFTYAEGRPSRAPAVRQVSLSIGRASVTALLGPNGCGKTTLLKLLAGVLQPQSGTVSLHGQPLAGLSRVQVARRVAMVPQELHPAFDFSCLEMVLMGRYPHLQTFALEGPGDFAAARGALEATGAAALATRMFSTLSGGEKQRVIIASALAQATEVLLLDEPTHSLDVGYRLEIASLLRHLNRHDGVTVVLATHDLDLAASLSHDVVAMRDGQVLATGGTADVLTAETIRRLYDVDAEVAYHERAGHLTVVPFARATI
jgi:iron complex transport system ATP-binding protein